MNLDNMFSYFIQDIEKEYEWFVYNSMNPNTNKSQFIILGNTGSHIPCPDVPVLSNFAPGIKIKFKKFIGEIKKNHWDQLIFHQEDKQKKNSDLHLDHFYYQ